jgi:hypothetical protein
MKEILVFILIVYGLIGYWIYSQCEPKNKKEYFFCLVYVFNWWILIPLTVIAYFIQMRELKKFRQLK